jgi:hypothetical protein
MQLQHKDPLSPASKDPAEGARDGAEGGDADGPIEEGHLGFGGDPAEGRDDEAATGAAPG